MTASVEPTRRKAKQGEALRRSLESAFVSSPPPKLANAHAYDNGVFPPVAIPEIGGFFVQVDTGPAQTTPVHRPELLRKTNMFELTPVMSSRDKNLVCGWLVGLRFRRNLLSVTTGRRFIRVARGDPKGFLPETQRRIVDAKAASFSSGIDEAAAVMRDAFKSVPDVSMSATLRGVYVLEIGDVVGMIVSDQTPNLSL